MLAVVPAVADPQQEIENLQAALAAERRRGDNLARALESSRMISMAAGILMAKYTLAADEAFALLVTSSQHTHRKVRDIAQDVVLTGDLDRS